METVCHTEQVKQIIVFMGRRFNPPFQVYHALRTQLYLNQKWKMSAILNMSNKFIKLYLLRLLTTKYGEYDTQKCKIAPQLNNGAYSLNMR